MKDFFTRYRESRKHYAIVPGIFGLVFGFAIVAQMTGTSIDLKTLQANVLETDGKQKLYDADLLMERSGSTLTFRMGKSADRVDVMYFTLLGDPSILMGVSAQDNTTTIENNEPGVYLIKIAPQKNFQAGNIVTTLSVTTNGDTPIALLDAGFLST